MKAKKMKAKKMKAKKMKAKKKAKKMEAKKKAFSLDSKTSDSSDSGMNSTRKIQKLLVKANESVRTVASGSPNAIDSLPDTGVDDDLIISTTQSNVRQPKALRWDLIGAAHAAGGNAEGNNEARHRASITVNGRGKVMAITPPAIDPDLSEITFSNQWSKHTFKELDLAAHRPRSGVYFKRWTGRASGKPISVIVTDRG
jgi:hypothetical protein